MSDVRVRSNVRRERTADLNNMLVFALLFQLVIVASVPSAQAETLSFYPRGDRTGSISSPGYPYTFESIENRTYRFFADYYERVQIIFDAFDVEKPHPNEECGPRNAVLSYKREDQKMAYVCGPDKPLPILSDGSQFILSYHMPNGPRQPQCRGFNATYKFVRNFGIESGVQTPYKCEFSYSSESKSGMFYSPNYPGYYPKNMECTYEFHGNETFLKINFTEFNLFGSPKRCSPAFGVDYLELTQTTDRDPEFYFERLCGQREPFNITVNATSFFVVFKSSQIYIADSMVNEPRTFFGFRAYYEFTNDPSSSSERLNSSDRGFHLLFAFLSLIVLNLHLT